MFKVDCCTISISCMSLPLLLFPSLHFDGIALWGGMAWELGVREGSRYQTEVEFASRVNFSIFTHFLCFFSLKLLKLGEISLKIQWCKILDKSHVCPGGSSGPGGPGCQCQWDYWGNLRCHGCDTLTQESSAVFCISRIWNLALNFTFQICTKLLSTRISSSTWATVTTSTSFELSSSHALVTPIKFTKRQSVSQSVSQSVNDKHSQWSDSGPIKN